MARASEPSVWFVTPNTGPDRGDVTRVEDVSPGEGNGGARRDDAGHPVGPLDGLPDVAEEVLEDVAGHSGARVDRREDEEGLEHDDELEPVLHRVCAAPRRYSANTWAMPTASEMAPPGR
jgi:hypothetical protein